MIRVCVVSPSKTTLTETFIQAHIDHLPEEVICMNGYWLDYSWQGQELRDWHDKKIGGRSGRWLNILPRFFEYRIRRRFFPPVTDFEITRDFLRSQKVDVVLAEYGTTAAFITPACQAAGIPLVAHFHGFDASHYNTLKQFKNEYRKMFAYASSIVSVSLEMSRALMELGCPEKKLCYNPYGPDVRYFDVNPDYLSPTLIAVGRQTYKKAPYLTLDAFRIAHAACPELRLCMIGDGDLLEVSERLTRAWGIEGQVDLIGPAESGAIRVAMSNAFAFVQHSVQARDGDSEGTPVAILEAGAAGLPVISTRHAGIPEAVLDGKTGFIVEPGDSRHMADRILQLASDRKLTRKLGEAAKLHVSEKYSIDRHINLLDQILVEASVQNCK